MPDADLVLEDRIILQVGKANGLDYTAEELAPLADTLNKPPDPEKPEEANRDSLFLDHGDGTQTWVGLLKNFKWDKDAKALRADLHIVDEEIARKIEYQLEEGRARFGVSPRLLVNNDGGKARNIIVKSFSLVLNPAGGEELMLWAESVLKVNKMERYILGPVLVPGEVDLQNEIISEEEIRKSAHRFMMDLLYGESKMGENHSAFKDKVVVVESFLMPCDGVIEGQEVRKGTWLIGSKILDEDAWNKVLKGIYKGYSVGGKAFKSPVAVNQ